MNQFTKSEIQKLKDAVKPQQKCDKIALNLDNHSFYVCFLSFILSFA